MVLITNVNKVIEVIHDNMCENNQIVIYGDYDVDGLCCLLCLQTFFNYLNYSKVYSVEYTQRTHFIDKKIISHIISKQGKLCIICDTGSSELEELNNISQVSNVIVIDHHEGNINPNNITSRINIVNPTMIDSYNCLSGACVVYEVCMAYIRKYLPDKEVLFELQLTFYAYASLYADTVYGCNSYTQHLVSKANRCSLPPLFNHLNYFNISKRFILFSFAPPLNACFRNSSFYIINKLFLNNKIMISVDKQNLLLEMENIRNYARDASNLISEKCSKQVIGNFVLIDLSGLLNQNIPNKIIWDNKGLVANKIAGQYKKCCVCIVSTGSYYTVSVRDYYGRNVYKLFSTLYNIGGHQSAFGGNLTLTEIVQLRHTLLNLSPLLDYKNQRVICAYDSLSREDIYKIALKNEFKHPNEVILVRIDFTNIHIVWTPATFNDRYEQYILIVGDTKVYIKKESFCDESPIQLVHFFNSTSLKGEMVDE